MAIKINSTDVIDDNKNLVNIENINASGSITGGILATSGEASAGIATDVLMTPSSTAQAISTLGTTLGKVAALTLVFG